MTLALGAHIADEALTDFLSVYNPIVSAARERWRWFPMPTFTFGAWLSGLIILVLVLLALTPLARDGALLTHVLAIPFAIIIGVLNGCGHIGASIYFSRWMPGTTTAPLLIGCGVWLLFSAAGPGHHSLNPNHHAPDANHHSPNLNHHSPDANHHSLTPNHHSRLT